MTGVSVEVGELLFSDGSEFDLGLGLDDELGTVELFLYRSKD